MRQAKAAMRQPVALGTAVADAMRMIDAKRRQQERAELLQTLDAWQQAEMEFGADDETHDY